MIIKKHLQLYKLNNIKVWSIALDYYNRKITIQSGIKNSELKEKIITFGSCDRAKSEFNKKLEEKLKKGYQEITKNKKLNIEVINETYMNYLYKMIKKYATYKKLTYNKLLITNGETNNLIENVFNKMVTKFDNKNVKSMEKYKESLQNKNISVFNKSGVIIGKIPNDIKKSLLESILDYSNKIAIDYHPGSNNKVRDIVHPSIYPLIVDVKKTNAKTDYWNRPYENSKYQWLPSEFIIDENGKCKIDSYINNLPIDEIEMYKNIEKLFEYVVPQFENMWSYINAIKLYKGEPEEYNGNYINYLPLSLKNRNLQIITKIVKIELDNKGNLEGAWHVEGMSHENIVAAASCTLEQNKNFDAKILFKRKYTIYEAYELFSETYEAPIGLNKFLNEGTVPLGKYNIKDASLVVFPNSHIHKIDMKSNSKSKISRTIVVFWLINPDIRIKSTKDIKQQNYDIKIAHEVRLKLMDERKLYKNSFNIRDLSLCEH